MAPKLDVAELHPVLLGHFKGAPEPDWLTYVPDEIMWYKFFLVNVPEDLRKNEPVVEILKRAMYEFETRMKKAVGKGLEDRWTQADWA